MGSLQQRFEKFLYQPGLLGDLLSSLEAKTGVKRNYLATGGLSYGGEKKKPDFLTKEELEPSQPWNWRVARLGAFFKKIQFKISVGAELPRETLQVLNGGHGRPHVPKRGLM